MIKKYRKKNKYSQEQLAEILNISTRQLQRIENKESEPKISTLKHIIKILNISDKDIIEYMKENQNEYK